MIMMMMMMMMMRPVTRGCGWGWVGEEIMGMDRNGKNPPERGGNWKTFMGMGTIYFTVSLCNSDAVTICSTVDCRDAT